MKGHQGERPEPRCANHVTTAHAKTVARATMLTPAADWQIPPPCAAVQSECCSSPLEGAPPSSSLLTCTLLALMSYGRRHLRWSPALPRPQRRPCYTSERALRHLHPSSPMTLLGQEVVSCGGGVSHLSFLSDQTRSSRLFVPLATRRQLSAVSEVRWEFLPP